MNKTTKTFTYIIGIVMTIAMVGSLILPMISQQTVQGDFSSLTPEPTPFPQPTMPPPPDISAIDFDRLYLHRSGLFVIGAPTGWEPASDGNTADELRAGLSNSELQSVVEVRINKNLAGLADAEGLSGFFDRSWLGHSWSGYTSWDETGRRITEDGIVRIDFNLRRGRAYLIARQESWLENGDIYSVRVVTAENAPQELKFLLAGMAKSVELLPYYAGGAFGWDAYFDNLDKHIVRFPRDWEVSDAAAGLPATIAGDGAILAVGTYDVALANDDEAASWIEEWRSGVTARTVEAVDVAGAAGYKVSYRLSTLDGATESGLAVMLHGTDNRLHIANLRFQDLNEDLLEVDPAEQPLIAVVDSFRLAPDLEVALQPSL